LHVAAELETARAVARAAASGVLNDDGDRSTTCHLWHRLMAALGSTAVSLAVSEL
jgi:hypothetical protein